MAIRINGTTGIDMGNTPVSNVDVGALDYNAVNKEYADLKQSKSELAYDVDTGTFITNTLASGAIIERGSNANGEYVKFADGTLICGNSYSNASCSILNGSLYESTEITFTFPATFTSTPKVFYTASNVSFGMGFNAPSTTSSSFKAVRLTSGTAGKPSAMAISKWN